jgi:hypothetical protein
VNPKGFETNFRDGIYNGGFLGATRSGIAALEWLAVACLYKCEVDYERGLFYDQKYYDLLASRFEGVLSLRHHGCNVANWNTIDSKRVQSGDTVLINGVDPVVFIHFTKSTMRGILDGSDVLLSPFLEEYTSALKAINPAYKPFTLDTDNARAKPNGFFRRIWNAVSGDHSKSAS